MEYGSTSTGGEKEKERKRAGRHLACVDNVSLPPGWSVHTSWTCQHHRAGDAHVANTSQTQTQNSLVAASKSCTLHVGSEQTVLVLNQNMSCQSQVQDGQKSPARLT